MEPRYTLAARPLFVLALFTPLAAHGQGVAYDHLDVNQVNARLYSWGLIGTDLALGAPDFEVPVGGGVHPLYSAGLWFTGTDAGSTSHLAAIKFEDGIDSDYWPGPLTTDGSASIDPLVSDAFDRVWCVEKADVLLQQDYFDCLSTPGCDAAALYPGYVVPAYFYEWPAHGPDGYDLYLAPFNDFDADGVYDPNNGDSPCIPGDKACYVVFNDQKIHPLTGGTPLGVQVQMMAFAYDGLSPALDQTVFLYYKAENKTTATYSDSYVGLFSDFDLGHYEDDYVGSDPARNLLYVCNADNDDEATAFTPGYGMQPPAFGAVILQGPRADYDGTDVAADTMLFGYNGLYVNDGTIDNEHHGLSYAGYMLNSGGPIGEPALGSEYINHLKGRWNDGTPQTYGGDGYGGSVDARFVFPDDTDPDGVGTGGTPQPPWSEYSAMNPPFDRRGLGSMGPFTWEPGAIHNMMFAYVYARAASGGPQASIGALQARVDSVRSFANGFDLEILFAEDFWCGGPAAAIHEQGAVGGLPLFPTPTNGLVQVTLPVAMLGQDVIVRDALGRIVLNERATTTTPILDLSRFAPGVYSCEIANGAVRIAGRIVKE